MNIIMDIKIQKSNLNILNLIQGDTFMNTENNPPNIELTDTPRNTPLYNNYSSEHYIFTAKEQDDGILITMFDKTPNVLKTYNTTEIFISPKTITLLGYSINICQVNWYNKNSTLESNNSPSEVWAIIDEQLLLTDNNYRIALMRDLFNQVRVFRLLKMGLQTLPDIECGRYIGRIDEEYLPHLNIQLGKAAHMTPEMVKIRDKIQEKQFEESKQAAMQDIENHLRDTLHEYAAMQGIPINDSSFIQLLKDLIEREGPVKD